MSAHLRRLIALVLTIPTTFGVTGCDTLSQEEPPNQRWTGVVSDVRVQWSAEPGIDLTEGIAVPVRAYLESYDLVQWTGTLDNAYPGFTDAVPPNDSPAQSRDASTWDRRPSVEVALTSKLVGNLRFHLLAVERVEGASIATVCSYSYGLGEERSTGQFSTLPTAGNAESRGITGVRLNLTASEDETASHLPPQSGPTLSPNVDVFGGRRIVGYLTSASVSNEEWPTHEQVEAECIAKAPDPIERRDFLIRGPHPASEFSAVPTAPGWPQS